MIPAVTAPSADPPAAQTLDESIPTMSAAPARAEAIRLILFPIIIFPVLSGLFFPFCHLSGLILFVASYICSTYPSSAEETAFYLSPR
jgi:predicted secreted protein